MPLNLRYLQSETQISTHSKTQKPTRGGDTRHIHLLMGDTSKESIRPPPSGKIPKETRLPFKSPNYGHLQTLNSIARLSPRNNGSALYDSYELRAVTCQLNKAMRQPSDSSPAYLCYLKSPLYSQCASRGNTKKMLCSHLTCATINRNARNMRTKEVTRGFAAKLWNKVKQGLLGSNSNMQRNELRRKRCIINCS